MADAAAPFSTSMDAMSSGLMSDARFWAVAPPSPDSVMIVELSIGTPSIMKSGCPSPLIVLGPRIRIYEDEPGSPDDDTTSTLGALPASADTTLVSLDLAISDVSTELTADPSRSRVWLVPSPV